MKCIDLFSGIGGISLGLHGLVKTILYCEVNPYCQQVLAARMKDGRIDKAPIHGDINLLHLQNTNSLKPIMLCGGFPCQDISAMGLQKGIIDSSRSSLFFEILRLLDDTNDIQYVFLENVANITRCGLHDVITQLTKRGFNMQWTMKSAASLGAPHVRNRWFCIGIKNNAPFEPLSDILSRLHDTETNPDTTSDTHPVTPSETSPDTHPATIFETPDKINPETHSDTPWQNEPISRVWLRPNPIIASNQDPSTLYEDSWIQRCQCLGNTVVPCVVRTAFLYLLRTCLHWQSISSCFYHCSRTLETLLATPSLPEEGIIINSIFIPLPPSQPSYVSSATLRNPTPNIKITLSLNGTDISLAHLPTPRRGLTHASKLTERSIRDLPTVLVYSKENIDYIASRHPSVITDMNTTPLHSIMVPNVNYIEWMMGYPKDWTKIPNDNNKYRTRLPSASSSKPEPYLSCNEQPNIGIPQRTPTPPSPSGPAPQPSPTHTAHTRYNGMHMLMREMPRKDIKQVATAWRLLTPQEKERYSKKAKECSSQS